MSKLSRFYEHAHKYLGVSIYRRVQKDSENPCNSLDPLPIRRRGPSSIGIEQLRAAQV